MSDYAAVLDLPVAGEQTQLRIYDSPLPHFVEAALERLYANVFASCARVRSLGLAGQARAFVATRDGQVSCVLLFCQNGAAVEVLAEALALDAADIEAFAETVFGACPGATRIVFPAVQSRIARLPFPYQQFDCLEDIVAELPDSTETYFSMLGKNMRTSLKRYQRKIALDFPGFRYAFYEKGDISEQQVGAIVSLSSARIASKNQAPTHTGEKTRQLIRLARECGVMLVATLEGRVVAGVVCTIVGGNVFMHVVAHDPLYDDYRLGKVCCYLSICDAIARGAREYHFLWGRYEYKYRLLGVQRDYDRLVIYRSRLALLANAATWLRTAWRGHGRRAKRWLLAQEDTDNKWANALLGAWRRISSKA
jgi:CelD/BcsL family acetyltransferase involved in cellulose biosynthesis